MNTCVFFNFCWATQSKHACDTKWTAHKSTFVWYTRAIFCALHASNNSCPASESVFLCAACKLTGYLPKKDQGIQWNSMLAKHDKTRGHEFCQVFTYPYSNPLWMPNTIIPQGLDSTRTNNLTRLVTQCACILYQIVHIRDLNSEKLVHHPRLQTRHALYTRS